MLKGIRGPSGVVVELDGRDTEVACRALVIIASGGYANNTEWINKYTGLEPGRTVMPMVNAGGLHAESYSMRNTPGIASAFAIISGRVVRENAAKQLKL
jgi:hypothetical protein